MKINSVVNFNNTHNTQNNQQPYFTAKLKVMTSAYDTAQIIFKSDNLFPPKFSFNKGLKHFIKNTKEIYKNFGFDGFKCLYAESFLGRTNMKTMKKIMEKNVEAASEHLSGEIILGQDSYKKIQIWKRNQLLIMYKPKLGDKETHYAVVNRNPDDYFPPQLSVHNINKAVYNIVNDAEEAFAAGRILNTSY